MRNFEWNGRVIEYDENLWKEVSVDSDELFRDDCNRTLKYIGDVVEGQIVGEVPPVPTMWQMFANRTDLVDPPVLKASTVIDNFVGCTNLQPSEKTIKAYQDLGTSAIDVFNGAGCVSFDAGIEPEKSVATKLVGNFSTAGEFDSDALFEVLNNNRSRIQNQTLIGANAQTIIVQKIPAGSKKKGNLVASKYGITVTCELKDNEWRLGKTWIYFEDEDEQGGDSIVHASESLGRISLLNRQSSQPESTPEPVIAVQSVEEVIAYSAEESVKQSDSAEVEEPVYIESRVSVTPASSDDVIHAEELIGKPVYDYGCNDGITISETTGDIMLSSYRGNTSICAGKDGTVINHGDSVVEAVCPLEGYGILTIKGDGTLTLRSSGIQPCIGNRTIDSLKFSRWKVSANPDLTKIVIDGVSVVCQSAIKNFSIGTYGREFMPEVVLLNGGTIIYPEANCVRTMGAKEEVNPERRKDPVWYKLSAGVEQ